ncbi:hypothetical protein V2J09_004017 [Rumex salicifolius]
MVGVTFDHVCDWSTGGGIPVLTLVDRCKELCRARERNERHASLVLNLDHVGDHAWGASVLALMYHHLTTRKVKLKYASLVLDLDHVGDHA